MGTWIRVALVAALVCVAISSGAVFMWAWILSMGLTGLPGELAPDVIGIFANRGLAAFVTAASALAAVALVTAGTLIFRDKGQRGGKMLLTAGGLQLFAVLFDAVLSGRRGEPWDQWLGGELFTAAVGVLLSLAVVPLMGLGIWHTARRRFREGI